MVTVHDLLWRRVPEAYPARGRGWHEAALRRALRRADRFVVPAEVVADDLVDAGAPEAGDHRDPHGVRPPAAARLRRRPRPSSPAWASRGPFLLCVGTLEPRKNLARLIEAYGRIRGSLPEPWPLVVVGPTGWGEQVGAGHRGGPGRPGVAARAGRPLRQGPAAGLRAADRGLRAPAGRGHGVRHPGGGQPAAQHRRGAAFEVDPHDTDSIADGLLRVATDDAERTAAAAARARRRSAELTWTAIARRHVAVWDAGPASDRCGAAGGRRRPAALARRDRRARPAGGGRPVHHAAGRRPGRRGRRRPGAVQPARGRGPGGGRLAPEPTLDAGGAPGPGRSGWPGSSSGCPGCWPARRVACTTAPTTRCPSARRCPPW